MPDQRSVMKEFRSLEQKRASQGLSAAEEARLAQLRELIGPDSGAGGLRGGFDVNAAAARLRDSLLPAGMRNRPAPPPPEAEPPPPAPEAELSPADALAGAYAEQPFVPLEGGEPSDALFDPSSLGLDAAPPDGGVLATEWNAGSADAAGAPYDPAAAGYDASAGAYDPNAEGYAAPAGDAGGWDPAALAAEDGGPAAEWQAAPPAEGEPGAMDPYAAAAEAVPTWDPNAAGSDPNAAAAWDPNAAATWDPNAPPAWDPAQPYDPSAAPSWDPNAPPPPDAAWDAAQPDDASAAQGWDPSAPPQPDAAWAAAGWDPNALPAPGAAWDLAEPHDPNALEAPPSPDPAAAAPDPGAPPAWDGGAAVDVAFEAFAAAAPEAPPHEASWDDPSAAASAEPDPASAGALDGGILPPEGWDVAPPAPDAALAGTPLGEYDESGSALPPGEDAGLESALPFDAAADAAFAEAAAPSGAPALGEYDDTAGFSGTFAEPPADLPVEGGGFEAAQAVAPAESEGWHPETAVDEGFQLESGGSFDAAAAAVAPEWAVADAPPWDASAAGAVQDDVAALIEAGATPVVDGLSGAPNAGGAPADADAYAEASPPDGAYGVGEPDAFQPEPVADAAPATAELAPLDVEHSEPEPSALADAAAEGATPFGGGAGEVGPADGDLVLDPEANAPELSGPAPALDFSRPDLSDGQPEDDFAPPQAAPTADQAFAEEEIPTIDGEEILEEIPADDGAAAPALPLDFEPLVVPATPARAAAAPAAAAPPPPPPAAPPPSPPRAVPAAPPPAAARAAPAAPPPAAPRAATPDGRFVGGAHRVVVHTVEGQVKRGVLEDADLAASSLSLAPQPGGAPELVDAAKVKAIFFMLAPGEPPPAAEGRKVRVTFRDGRQIAGFSPDYDETGPGFFMVPGDTRTNTGRIWVYRAAVKQVAVS